MTSNQSSSNSNNNSLNAVPSIPELERQFRQEILSWSLFNPPLNPHQQSQTEASSSSTSTSTSTSTSASLLTLSTSLTFSSPTAYTSHLLPLLLCDFHQQLLLQYNKQKDGQQRLTVVGLETLDGKIAKLTCNYTGGNDSARIGRSANVDSFFPFHNRELLLILPSTNASPATSDSTSIAAPTAASSSDSTAPSTVPSATTDSIPSNHILAIVDQCQKATNNESATSSNSSNSSSSSSSTSFIVTLFVSTSYLHSPLHLLPSSSISPNTTRGFKPNLNSNSGQHQFQIIKLDKITTAEREYIAVSRVSEVGMRRQLLTGWNKRITPTAAPTAGKKKDGDGDTSSTTTTTRGPPAVVLSTALSCWSQLPSPHRSAIESSLNPSQLQAIQIASSTSGFSLIQGPPGTGKTQTILSLLSVLLTQHFHLQHRHSLLDFSNRNDSLDSGRSTKILVCAPSNGGIDELTSRVAQYGLIDAYGKRFQPRIVRVGAMEKMREDVKKWSVSSLVSGFIEECMGNVRNKMGRLQLEMEEMRRKMEGEIIGDEVTSGQWKQRIEYQRLMNEYERCLIYTNNLSSSASTDSRRLLLSRHFISTADLVFCTLSMCGSDQMMEEKFDQLVIDEAAQTSEANVVVALSRLSEEKGERVVLVGDKKQLPATIFLERKVGGEMLERSLFARLEEVGGDIGQARTMLTLQYRMHPSIRSYPSLHFYDNQLIDAPNTTSLSYTQAYHSDERFGPYVLYDVSGSNASRDASSSSLSNRGEAVAVVELIEELVNKYGGEKGKVKMSDVAVLSPYSQQVEVIKRLVEEKFNKGRQRPQRGARPLAEVCTVEVCTVDSFQGREKPIIILSCVRAGDYFNTNIGFLRDVRRMNVAITRAKYALWIVGDMRKLRGAKEWKELVEDAEKRGLVKEGREIRGGGGQTKGKGKQQKQNQRRGGDGGGPASKQRHPDRHHPYEQNGNQKGGRHQQRGRDGSNQRNTNDRASSHPQQSISNSSSNPPSQSQSQSPSQSQSTAATAPVSSYSAWAASLSGYQK